MATILDAATLREQLDKFTGSVEYHQHASQPLLNLTDGAKYFIQQVDGAWLLGIIGSLCLANQVKGVWENHIVIKISVDDMAGTTIDIQDGNYNQYANANVGPTDIPEGEWELWLIGGVLLLPSEY